MLKYNVKVNFNLARVKYSVYYKNNKNRWSQSQSQ